MVPVKFQCVLKESCCAFQLIYLLVIGLYTFDLMSAQDFKKDNECNNAWAPYQSLI